MHSNSKISRNNTLYMNSIVKVSYSIIFILHISVSHVRKCNFSFNIKMPSVNKFQNKLDCDILLKLNKKYSIWINILFKVKLFCLKLINHSSWMQYTVQVELIYNSKYNWIKKCLIWTNFLFKMTVSYLNIICSSNWMNISFKKANTVFKYLNDIYYSNWMT